MTPNAARYDRAAIMRDAHKRFADGRRLGLGWSFGQCLATAWAAAKIRQAADGAALAYGRPQLSNYLRKDFRCIGWSRDNYRERKGASCLPLEKESPTRATGTLGFSKKQQLF